MTFAEHLLELRFKFLLSCLAVAVGAGVAHAYHPVLIRVLLTPLGDRELFFLSPLDPLLFILKVDLAAGIVLALPVINWGVLSFIRPSMSQTGWWTFSLVYAAAFSLPLCGIGYAFVVVMPISMRFLLSIQVPGIENMISASSYLRFLLVQTALISLVFQIPLFVLSGTWIGAFTPAQLAAQRRFVYAGGLIVLAIITPTVDLFSLATVAAPAAAIYEVSLLASAVLLGRRAGRRSEAIPR